MAVVRSFAPILMGALIFAAPLGAQAVGNVSGKVVDSASSQPLPNASVIVEGTASRTLTRTDGTYDLIGVPAGTHGVRARRIGYGSSLQSVTVTAGGSTTANFTLSPRAAVLTEMVVTGYGAQRREAITGAVAKLDADVARVGTPTNATQLMQGRVAGVQDRKSVV